MKNLLLILLLFCSFIVYGQLRNSPSVVNSQLSIFSKDYLLSVAMGEVEGAYSINKFGHNGAATSGDDIWEGGGEYDFYPDYGTALSMQISSTDTDDKDAGTGAWTVEIYGLNILGDLVTETVTLNGTTPVNLDSSYWRMYRAIVITAGSTHSNEGALTIEEQGGSGLTGAYIGVLDGQTQQILYTTPRNTESYFIKGYVGISDDDKNGETAEFQWRMRPNVVSNGAWAVKGEIGLNNIGSSTWQYSYGVPAGPIPELTDLGIIVVSATVTLGVVSGLDLLIIETE